MSWLSAAWDRNKGAIVSLGSKALTGDFKGVGTELLGDARAEAGRVIARSNAPPEAQAMLLADAQNALTVAGAAAGIRHPSTLNPLGVQGQQQIAIGGHTVSVNTLALVGIAIVLLFAVTMISRRHR